MTTCRCCGQILPPGDESGARRERAWQHATQSPDAAGSGDDRRAERTSIGVDDALLSLCNRAHGEAERRGSAWVEIAHLVIAFTTGRLADDDYEREGLSRLELAIAAERSLAVAARGIVGAKPRTSAELRVLLARAEAVAKAEAREFASPGDLVRALAHRSRDLVSARFVPDARTPARGRSVETRAADRQAGGGSWRELRQSRFDFDPRTAERTEDVSDPADRGVSNVSAQRGEAGLIERLERQEQVVASLLGLISRLMDGRSGASSASGASLDEDDDEPACRGRSRLSRRWRRRTIVVGSGRGLRATKTGQARGRTGSEGVLRLVTPGDGARATRRSKGQRDIAPDFEDTSLPVEAEIDDDADGQGDRMKRFYLAPDDDIVKAPSIGPKTAARLTPAGLVLVRDLLSCDPEDVARRTANRYITASRIAEWKAQARLVCTIPWLRGTHAQLLVGAGYDTLAKLSRADASSVCAAILRFVATREGQSILRSSPPPEIDRIACWIENTALAEPARAA